MIAPGYSGVGGFTALLILTTSNPTNILPVDQERASQRNDIASNRLI